MITPQINVKKKMIGGKARLSFYKSSYIYTKDDLNSFKEIILMRGDDITKQDELDIIKRLRPTIVSFQDKQVVRQSPLNYHSQKR